MEVFREIQDILQDNGTGRVVGLCSRNFNIKEWEQPVFYLFSADVFKYSHSGGRRGRPVLTSSRIEIFCLIGFTGGAGRLWSRENKM